MATIEERLNDQPQRLVILAAVAFARTVEYLLVDQRSKDAIDVAERFADGFATIEEVKIAAASAAAARWGATSATSATSAAKSASASVLWTARAASWASAASWAASWASLSTSASAASAEATSHLILDCILPTRIEVSFPIHIKGLAKTIYDKKDFGLMPIIADALEEIGQVDMSLHCRELVHTKGCWVLDSILGK